jgi:saccharopine dehydrogenase-like NADP-dependent oxidoreductase
MSPSVLLLGAGEMGKAIAHDLSTFAPDLKLSVLDSSPEALQGLQEFLTSSDIRVVDIRE